MKLIKRRTKKGVDASCAKIGSGVSVTSEDSLGDDVGTMNLLIGLIGLVRGGYRKSLIGVDVG